MPPARGKGRPKELGAVLKRLGAFRLLKIANLSIAQAMDHSAIHRKGAINIPLYVNHADWAKTSATIDNMMAGFPEEMAKLTQLKPL